MENKYKLQLIITFVVSAVLIYFLIFFKPGVNKNQKPITKPLKIEKKEIKKDDGFIKGEILPGKGFEDSLIALKEVNLKEAVSITNALRNYVDFRYLKAHEPFKLKFNKDKTVIEKFIYNPDIITSHILTWNYEKEKFEYKLKVLETKVRYRIVEGKLKTTLNDALKESGNISNEVRAVINNVLECLVSFRTDARVGDSYLILLKEKLYKGEIVPGTKVLYASYEGKITDKIEAFYYFEDDESSAYNGHYSRDGRALIHSSLRMPLDRIHVTSPFGMRIHPVTRKRKFHYGVDYRGRTGDPVYAVAKGKVVRTPTNSIGGRQIEIRHSDGTTTVYMHLSRRFVKKGQYVKAHELIGKVGSTGRVSGSHLHFGIKSSRGKWLNPLRKRMIATPKLKGKRKKSLDKQIKFIEEGLKQLVVRERLKKAIEETGIKITN